VDLEAGDVAESPLFLKWKLKGKSVRDWDVLH